MKYIISLIALLAVFTTTSCAQLFPGVKFAPEYKDVDPRAQGLVDEYMWLSAQNNIVFKHKVTLGFKKIKDDSIIGTCTYGGSWREIDLDQDFWEQASADQRLALTLHELTHCYCGRSHDYAAGKDYPPTEAGRIAEAMEWRKTGGPKPGRFDDACPISFMYPVILDGECIRAHYSHYVQEMFDRCKPF